MNNVRDLKIILLVLGIQLGLGMISYYWLKGRKSPLLYRFIGYLILLILWFVGRTLHIFAGCPEVGVCLSQLAYFAACFMGWGWFCFCLYYTEYSVFCRKGRWIILGFIPIAAYILGLRQLAWGWPGAWSENRVDLFMLQSYVFHGAGTALLIRYFFRQYGGKLVRFYLLALALIGPYTVNEILRFGRIQTDFGSFLVNYLASLGVCLSLGFKEKLLDLKPFAWRQIFAELEERILVMDNFNWIISVNGPLTDIFPDWQRKNPEDLTGLVNLLKQVGESTPKLQQGLETLTAGNEESFWTEIKLPGPKERWVGMRVRPFWRGPVKLGRIISFTDISEHQRTLADFRRRNHRLKAMNRKLREQAATLEESVIVQERNRFAQDLHDTVGQTMNLVMTLLQVGMVYCRKDPSVTERKLDEAMRLLEEGLGEVRRSLLGLSILQSNSDNLVAALENLLASYKNAGLQGNLTVNGCSGDLSIKLGDVIYRLIQEGLTNAVRHGKAKNIQVKLTFTPEKVQIFIQDDGCGSHGFNKGMGLTGMETRIRALKGWIRIHSQLGQGFRIEVELPKDSPRLLLEDQGTS